MVIINAVLVFAGCLTSQDNDNQDGREECAKRMSNLMKAMINYSVTKMPEDREGEFPSETGPALWAVLLKDGDIKDKKLLRCPISGRTYAGPKSDSNKYGCEDAISLCEHGKTVFMMLKSGDIYAHDRESKMHKKALEATVGWPEWVGAGTTWTFAPDHKNGKPLKITLLKALKLGDIRGAVMEMSGGELTTPTRERLYLDETGVHLFGRWIGDKSVAPSLTEAELKRVDRWIKEVGSDSFALREKAATELAKHYPIAREKIDQALGKGDLESQTRLGTIRLNSVVHAPPKILYPLKKGVTWNNGYGERYEVIDSTKVKTPFGMLQGWIIRMHAEARDLEIIWSDEFHVQLSMHDLKNGKREKGWVLNAHTP